MASPSDLHSKEWLQLFARIDQDGDGCIGESDLAAWSIQVLAQQRPAVLQPISRDVLEKMMRLASSNRPSLVTRAEFIKLVEVLQESQAASLHKHRKSSTEASSDKESAKEFLETWISNAARGHESSGLQKHMESIYRFVTDEGSVRSFKQFVAGGIAGAVSRTSVSPLERMKILFQIQGPGSAKFTGIFPTLYHMWKEEGIKGYFKGNGTNIVRIVPYSAVQFASYEQFKKMMMSENAKDLTTLQRLAAGALAGITAVICTYPLDIVRTRLSIHHDVEVHGQEPLYKGIWHATKRIYREEGGVYGLYRGIWATLLGIAPYVALNFTVYETVKGWFAQRYGQITTNEKLMSGAISGVVAQTITYPLDVIRRRMQMVGLKSANFKYGSTWGALTTILREEGVRGLYKGIFPNLLKVAPSMSISFVTYEACKTFMNA